MKKFTVELNGDLLLDQDSYIEKGFVVSIISQNLPQSENLLESNRKRLIMLTSTKDKISPEKSTRELQVGDVVSLTINMGKDS